MTLRRRPSIVSAPQQILLSKDSKKRSTLTLRKNRKHIRQAANLFEWPHLASRLPLVLGSEVTLGDLHANAMKLLHFFLKQNIFELKEGDYHLLLNLYYKEALHQGKPSAKFTKADRKAFEGALSRAKLNPRLLEAIKKSKNDPTALLTLVRLIGDETGDRGVSDLLVLLVLNLLVDHQVPYKILASNHGFELLQCYEGGFKDFTPRFLKNPDQARSLLNLKGMIEDGITTSEELSALYEKCILPQLEAFDFTYDETTDALTIYTHGRVGLQTIKNFADDLKKFNPDFQISEMKWTNVKEITATLLEIREAFAKLKAEKKVSQFMEFSKDHSNAFYELIWSREYQPGDGPNDVPPGLYVHFVHGHTDGDLEYKEDKLNVNVTNLDNMFCKTLLMFLGEYSVLMESPKRIKMPAVLDAKCQIEKESIDDQRKRLKSFKESGEQCDYVLKQLKTRGIHSQEDLEFVLGSEAVTELTPPFKKFQALCASVQRTLIELRDLEQKENTLQEKEQIRDRYAQARKDLLQSLCYYMMFMAPQLFVSKNYVDDIYEWPFMDALYFEMVMHSREQSLNQEIKYGKEKELKTEDDKRIEPSPSTPKAVVVVSEPSALQNARDCLENLNEQIQELAKFIKTGARMEAEKGLNLARESHTRALQWCQVAPGNSPKEVLVRLRLRADDLNRALEQAQANLEALSRPKIYPITPKSSKAPATTPKSIKVPATTPKSSKVPATTPKSFNISATTPKSSKVRFYKPPTSSPKANSTHLEQYKNVLKKYLKDQCDRLPEKCEKRNVLQARSMQVKDLDSVQNAQSMVQELRVITNKHRDTGLIGFFKLTCLRNTRSYNQLTAHFNNKNNIKAGSRYLKNK